MVQRRKRTQFTGKFKEHLEKVEGIIQDAIDNLPNTDVESKYSTFLMHWFHVDILKGVMNTSDVKDFKDKDLKELEEKDKENCSSLDRIMCQIVDELSLDMD